MGEGSRVWVKWLIGGFVSLVVMLGLVALVLRKDVEVKLGGEIQIDDFAFRVDRAMTLPDSAGTYTELFVIELTVMNRAQRVDFNFKPEQAVIGAKNFDQVSCDVSQSQKLAEMDLTPMPAKTSRRFTLAYHLPKGATGKFFRICWGPGTDVLEKIFFGNKRILLD